VLIAKYLRAARHVPTAAPLARRYALGFGVAAALWLLALLVPTPARYAVWAVAMVVDVGTPLTARQHQARLPVSTSHLPERIGLFTIIVLGEAVAGTVRGSEAGLTALGVAAAFLAMTLAFCVWWVYFDNLDERVVRRTRVAGQVWFYTHLFLAMAITAMAVGGEHLVKLSAGEAFHGAQRWLLGGGFALALASLGVLHLTTVEERGEPRNRLRAFLRLGSAAAVLAMTAAGGLLPALAFGGVLAAVGVSQVVLDPPRKVHVAAS
jgi:low temperature requirement protein LtrA